jgi:hypothetical protein
MADVLRSGGKFCLRDVVYSFDIRSHERFLEGFISRASELAGPEFAKRIADHVKNEYSTMDWIMQGMIERAGFEIMQIEKEHKFFALYLCTKSRNESI